MSDTTTTELTPGDAVIYFAKAAGVALAVAATAVFLYLVPTGLHVSGAFLGATLTFTLLLAFVSLVSAFGFTIVEGISKSEKTRKPKKPMVIKRSDLRMRTLAFAGASGIITALAMGIAALF